MIEIKDEKFLIVASDIHSDDQAFELLSEKAVSESCLGFLYAGDLNVENCIISSLLQYRNFLFIPVQGNCDNKWEWTDLGIDLPLYRTCSFGGLKIFISHGHLYSDPESAGLSDADYDVVINGHSHVNDIKEQVVDSKRIIFLNPGSPSRPRGYSKPSYARIVFKNDGSVSFEIRALNGDGVLSHKTVSFHQAAVRND